MRRLVLVAVIGTLGVAQSAAAETQRFGYTGGEQVFIVPSGVSSVTVDAVGGRGGAAKPGDPNVVPGGFGAHARATFAVTPGQRLYVSVGGNGGDGFAAPGAGGFNGGGQGGTGNASPLYNHGGGGGGASDVRTGSRSDPLGAVKLITAGGGGGSAGSGVAGGAGAGGSAGSPGGNGFVAVGPCTPANGGAPGGFASPGQGGAGASIATSSPSTGETGGGGGFGTGGAGGAQSFPGGGGGGGGGGLYGGGGGGGGAAIYPSLNPNCTPGGGGGGSSGFAAGAGNASLALDQTGVPSVTFAYTPAVPPVLVGNVLSLTDVSLTNRAFRVGPAPKRAPRGIRYGTAFRFTLSAAAQVRFEIARRGIKPGCKPKGSGKCARFRNVASLTRSGKAGRNQAAFSGRHGKRQRPLPPGRYRATLTATDSAGLSSQPRRIGFRILAP